VYLVDDDEGTRRYFNAVLSTANVTCYRVESAASLLLGSCGACALRTPRSCSAWSNRTTELEAANCELESANKPGAALVRDLSQIAQHLGLRREWCRALDRTADRRTSRWPNLGRGRRGKGSKIHVHAAEV